VRVAVIAAQEYVSGVTDRAAAGAKYHLPVRDRLGAPRDAAIPVAASRPEKRRKAVPGTATTDSESTVSGCPCRAVRGRSSVILMPTILCPFIHIALDLIEAPWIRLK
jgi:hypothetical protein